MCVCRGRVVFEGHSAIEVMYHIAQRISMREFPYWSLVHHPLGQEAYWRQAVVPRHPALPLPAPHDLCRSATVFWSHYWFKVPVSSSGGYQYHPVSLPTNTHNAAWLLRDWDIPLIRWSKKSPLFSSFGQLLWNHLLHPLPSQRRHAHTAPDFGLPLS